MHVLYTVLSDGVRSGSIKPLSDYTASTGGWMAWSADVFLQWPARWTYRTVLKPSMLWAYSKLFPGANDEEDFCRPKTSEQIVASLPDEQFVFIDLVKVYTCKLVSCTITAVVNSCRSTYGQHYIVSDTKQFIILSLL